MKKIKFIRPAPAAHWVGDGFPVRSIFSYASDPAAFSPFLLLDYAASTAFPPSQTQARRGVGSHPHRGFETVTIVYEGEVEHRDTSGGGGKIGPGDVQWMTAASGILHEEFHSSDFTRTGGTIEMVQMWVNLPRRSKMSAPKYQAIGGEDIPVVALPDDAGQARVIAGEYRTHEGPATTFTPMRVLDVRLQAGREAKFAFDSGDTAIVVVLHGTVLVNGTERVGEAQLVLFDREGGEVSLAANEAAVFLVLSGEPIDEPVVGHGPFVMNSRADIVQAIDDFNGGRFGRLNG